MTIQPEIRELDYDGIFKEHMLKFPDKAIIAFINSIFKRIFRIITKLQDFKMKVYFMEKRRFPGLVNNSLPKQTQGNKSNKIANTTITA